MAGRRPQHAASSSAYLALSSVRWYPPVVVQFVSPTSRRSSSGSFPFVGFPGGDAQCPSVISYPADVPCPLWPWSFLLPRCLFICPGVWSLTYFHLCLCGWCNAGLNPTLVLSVVSIDSCHIYHLLPSPMRPFLLVPSAILLYHSTHSHPLYRPNIQTCLMVFLSTTTRVTLLNLKYG